MSRRFETTEASVYEFRNESFTNINQVEQIFLKKNDVLRRAIADMCKQLNLTNALLSC